MTDTTRSKKGPRPNPLALDRFLTSSMVSPTSGGPAMITPTYPSPVTSSNHNHGTPKQQQQPTSTTSGMKLAMFSTTKYVDEQRGDFKQFRPAIHPPNVLENISDASMPSPQGTAAKHSSSPKTMRTAAEIWKDGMFEHPDQVTDFARSNDHRDRLRLAPVTLKGGRVVQQQFAVENAPLEESGTTFLMLPSQRRKAFQQQIDKERARQVATKSRRAENQLNRIIHHQYPHGFLGGETTMSENTLLYSEKSEQNKKVEARMAELTERRKRWIELNENKVGSGGKSIIRHLSDKSDVTETSAADEKPFNASVGGTSGGYKFLQSKVRCTPKDNFSVGTMCCASAEPRAASPHRQQMLSYYDSGQRDYNILSGAAVKPAQSPFT